ncbi:SpoIIE family protein phosphatase [Imhoffiella purpurea]|uniref:Phosphoserine phosphatase RsbX n=1 Tax=Imhoffiella purpurea TaxID=1249627 RepID=W9V344_9GAMM|nr:SpoIIE family protein phosphatase [Imhoffiella purpurea]EXJ13913.1 Phosphoserine phosphatase RsbX [Imhoffiella purpurea]
MALNPPSPPPDRAEVSVGQAVRPLPGERLCGDQSGWWTRPERLRMALADGLGHGPEAHAAAVTLIERLAVMRPADLTELFADCDRALIGSRGAALAVVDVLFEENALLHAAVGNVRTLLIGQGQIRRLAGARGIVGGGFSGLRPERLPLSPGDWLVMFSDGIPEDADIRPSLIASRPSDALAGRLLERWASDRDDAGILLYRHE